MSAVPWWADDDPWRLSPGEQEAADERQRQSDAERAATPDEPPF